MGEAFGIGRAVEEMRAGKCKDPHGSDVKPVFIEPRIIVSPFRLERNP